jgi:hypothetical protein
MMRRLLVPAACFLAGILVASGAATWLRPAPSAPAAGTGRATSPADPLALSPEAIQDLSQRLAEKERGDAEQAARAGETAQAAPLPKKVTYRVEKKLAPKPLSQIPYELVGAWDDAPKAAQPGEHRAFVLVVDPELSNEQLAALVRDVEAKNSDADQLDIRIYDEADAATRPRYADGGAYARQHLVAQGIRHRGLHVDVIRVRGKRIEP